MPLLGLAVEHGGPAVPGRVCVETAIEPIVDDRPAEIMTTALATLVQVVTTDCEAVLRVEMSGRRLSATYVGSGRCYSGWDVSGALTWSVRGADAGRWPVAAHRTPPGAITQCAKENDTINLSYDVWPIGQMLVDLFGGAGFAALFVVFPDYSPRFPSPGEGPPSRSDVFAVSIEPIDAAALGQGACDVAVARILGSLWQSVSGDERDWLTYRLRWFAIDPCGGSRAETLARIIPYLVAALADEEGSGQKYPHTGLLRAVLIDITGQTFGSAQGWWEWWQRQPH